MTADDHDALKRDMHALAQESILTCFSNLIRLRVAAQSDAQRITTLLIVQTALAEVLKMHETQTYDGPATELSDLRGSLFRSEFDQISGDMLAIMGSGLTAAENQLIQQGG